MQYNIQSIMYYLKTLILTIFTLLVAAIFPMWIFAVSPEDFQTPPDSARPWVYFFIMDGNLSKEGITADLEAMREQGIGGLILMEVNVGVPRGHVDFMSEEWQAMFAHIIHEAERLGLQVGLSSGPGWAGSGGPWITPEQSMLHLVASELNVRGPIMFDAPLPVPQPRVPFFGEGQLPPEVEEARKAFFKDVRVLAFRKPEGTLRTLDVDEKAAYVRAPYSSAAGVKPRIPSPVDLETTATDGSIDPAGMLDLTAQLDASGILKWNVPDGEWTILRFAATSTGANTRPAPYPGLGLESSKMDKAVFDFHAEQFISKLFSAVGQRRTDGKAGWCFFHLDSWEMGPQNYTSDFFLEFHKRRGYDPLPFLPAYAGFIVESPQKTERFLWDVRQTAQELIVENHGMHIRDFSHKNGLLFSNEPYDMMPCCDMTFGAIADVPMCEFWSNTFDTAFSCFEAASTAHTNGRRVVAAEAFTSGGDAWQQNPKTMKQRGDWAFCSGVNRFTFHRYQHQPLPDRTPGFSMGGYGVHWERTQTWWPLVGAYHRYLARCQHVLQQGIAVVDVLYLLPEGAPQVFTPPPSALIHSGLLKDQRGYRFDGCEPDTFLRRASVEDGMVAFPDGTKYRLLVLPDVGTMTLPMLEKIESLIWQGATVVGNPPKQSPSLQDYPHADEAIRRLAGKIWGEAAAQPNRSGNAVMTYGKGRIIALPTEDSPSHPDLSAARWIWYPEGNPAHDVPAGKRYFQKTICIPQGQRVERAVVLGVADNQCVVKVNGIVVHQSCLQGPIVPSRFDSSLRPGDNLIEIEATNDLSDQRNPAGLIARFQIGLLQDNSRERTRMCFSTDDGWQASTDGKNWEPAMVLGDFGMAPWGGVAPGLKTVDAIYPEYEVTAKILADAGIPTDSDAPEKGLRYFHRRDGETDYYFVGNRSETAFQGDVAFRVAGKPVSIWDPVTGLIFRTLPTKMENGRTLVPLNLEGSQSVFVVFSGEEHRHAPVWQSFAHEPLLELTQDWEVAFDPQRGGPEQPLHFPQLQDWSLNARGEVKYYSGMATYRKTFAVSDDLLSPGANLWLDLGNVEVIARVKLNGEDIGTRWVSPYRFDITDKLRKGENTLEIEAANLWPNRLIGDAALPPEKRTTWTTFHDAYHPQSPLLPSGLLGPIRISTKKTTEP